MVDEMHPLFVKMIHLVLVGVTGVRVVRVSGRGRGGVRSARGMRPETTEVTLLVVRARPVVGAVTAVVVVVVVLPCLDIRDSAGRVLAVSAAHDERTSRDDGGSDHSEDSRNLHFEYGFFKSFYLKIKGLDFGVMSSRAASTSLLMRMRMEREEKLRRRGEGESVYNFESTRRMFLGGKIKSNRDSDGAGERDCLTYKRRNNLQRREDTG